MTKLPGVRVSGLTAAFQASHAPGQRRWLSSNFGEEVPTGADGRFVFDGLDEGTINVFVRGQGENKDWTYRAAQDVALELGETSEVTIELIRGVDVEGTVIVRGTGAPVEGAEVGVNGPSRPSNGSMPMHAETDARGRYCFRLPPGDSCRSSASVRRDLPGPPDRHD